MLSAWGEFLNDIGNGYNREFVKNGATFIDYGDLYRKFGMRGAQKRIAEILEEGDLKVLVYHSSASDFHFDPPFFQSLGGKVFRVMTCGDSDYYFDIRDIYYAQAMDLVLVYDWANRYRFMHYGVPAISFYSSYDGKKYHRTDGMEKDIAVSFVGDTLNYAGRREYVDCISQSGISVETFGTGSKNGPVSLEEMVSIFNRTKINLNFTGILGKSMLRSMPDINSLIRQLKGRIAEVALSGGFVLSEYAPGIEEVFKPDSEIVIFRSKEELIEKITYYLAHDAEREAIANAAHKRALRDYAIGSAIPALVGRINELRKQGLRKPQGIYLDKRFIKYFTTFRAAMIAEFLRLGRWRFIMEELGVVLKNRRLDLYRAAALFVFGIPGLKRLYLKYKNTFKL